MSRTIGFLAGVLLLQQLAELPEAAWAGAAVLLPVLFAHGPRGRAAAAVVAGFLWAWLQAAVVLAPSLPSALEGRDLTLQGRVGGLVEVFPRASRFVFDVRTLTVDGKSRPFRTRVRLSWYGRAPKLRCGETWRLTVRLKRPHGFANPGGFDYEGWLYRRGIRATGYVRPHGSNQRLEAPSGYPLQRLRESLGRRLRQVLADNPESGVLTALALGERNGVPPARLALLRATGTGHLLAISGLHVGLVAALAFAVMRRFWSFSARAVQWLAAPRAAAWAALAAGLLYSALAGFSIPTRRAFVVLAVMMGAVLLGRSAGVARVWSLALLAVLMLDPRAVLAPGFWLSFGAVAVIGCGLAGYRSLSRWRRTLRVQAVVSLALIPAGLAAFQQASLVAPLANLVAVPWVGLVVVPLTLVGTLLTTLWPGGGGACLWLAGRVLGGLWPVLAWLAHLPGAFWHHGAPPVWAAVLAVGGLLWLLLPRGLPARWVGTVLVLPALAIPTGRPAPGAVWMTVLDVGQGLATVVRTHGHTLVYDTGPRFSARFDAGSAVLVPFLRQRGIGRVDTLIVSNDDNDHAGGAAALLAALPVGKVLSGTPEALPDLSAAACHAPQSWVWDEVRFRILHPAPGTHPTGNDASCVLRIEGAGGGTFLLTGDIETPVERRLLADRRAQLHSTVLIAPHHGSLTSSTVPFVVAAAPRYVLFSTGYHNRYGFPKPQVQARYRDVGAQMIDTARAGAIQVRLKSDGTLRPPQGWRARAAHYWNDRF